MDVQRAAGLKARLRDSGLRATGPRAEVLAVLEDLGGHRTAEEIYDTLAARDAGVPRSSVYNVLTTLSDAGLVLKADAGPGVVLYEAGGRWHHHFVCRNCARVFDVECVVELVSALPRFSVASSADAAPEVSVKAPFAPMLNTAMSPADFPSRVTSASTT